MSDADESASGRDAERLFRGPCEFVAGAATLDAIPASTLAEVAFVGRSNVGKSSLINALTGRTALARISQTPGRTRQINFFRLGDVLMLVDLPGYGFAQASKALAAQWQRLIFDYLRGRPNLARVILLVDARRGIMEIDREAMRLLDSAAVSYLVVLTKADKLSPPQAADARAEAEHALKRQVASYPDVLLTSSLTGTGLEGLRRHIAALASGNGFGV